ncbi:cell division protein ZapE [Pseudomonas sp. S 311-6]|uniref:cell division protein ZapE n=1 Tax=Pseudomonas TaxID=286 RepID=UPI001CE3DA8C|nr:MULTISPECIES: cell division protein ZapE [Pseudomonas]MCO7564399.1 cell division protein ZapE [Pseudomonas mosselii]MCO7615801.1 cell division protein ZapE [Pseudomonas guariconensis]MCO7632742.1 cell division protein ZapE [Pseudomonas guariconensis]MCO7638678.1 cell division protein ZapE [Pseudomonas sp. S 311-6]
MPLDPRTLYQQALDAQGFVPDAAQALAVDALQACFEALTRGESTQGVYLWGPVGRGKTWLMDQFHRCLQVAARRQHFHHFMAWVHQRLFQLNGTADPLQALARELAGQIRVLCFDELFVSDIGDAIILGRLFQVLFDQGVVIVATSNQPPHQLYRDGFNRERFLPAIAAIERHMRVLAVAGEQDHRLHPGAVRQRYWVAEPGQPGALQAVFQQLSPTDAGTDQPLQVGSRQVRVVRRSAQAIWCRFADLCEQPLAAMEFMALCDRFAAILVDGIPALGGTQRAGRIARGTEDGARRVEAGDRELPTLAPKDDSVRRFIALVDECYDRRVALYLEAEVPLEALYTQGYLAFPYQRTLSRLREMQLQRFA